ncbi:MAG TPA: sugar porter family MFS transporter [Terriglobia bacterium]|nr:sugar porter family MFS transporter [Terriglobia bacterium]
MKLNAVLLRSAVVAGLAGLMFGFDTAVISGTTADLTEQYHLTQGMLGVTVFIALVGTILGSALGGIPGEKWGRRNSLRGLAILYLLSAVGCAFAWGWYPLLGARLVAGLGIGGSSVLAPMYIAEIAPAKWRGRLVGLFQINIVFGILVAYFSNYIIGLFQMGLPEWRAMLGIAAFPAALFFVMLFGIPKSPRWLVSKGRVEEAREVFRLTGEENAEKELQDIVASLHAEQQQERLFSLKYRFPIFLAVSIAMFNQFSGINAILYYLNDIFMRAGFTKISGSLQAVLIGATNMIFTLVAMAVIDKLGRRTLLLIGSVGMALCLGGVAAIFLTARHENWLVWMLVGFIACFAFSQGAVIWVYISEVFPNQVRAKGQSLGTLTHWVVNAAISLVYPLIAKSSGGYPFVFFSAMMVIQFFVVMAFYPETKGVTLEEMQTKLGIT